MTHRVRRSLLIAPSHHEDLVRKLSRSACDVCLLELEDGVPSALKQTARESAASLLRDLDWAGRERVVRINRVTEVEGELDIAIVTGSCPDALLIPKVEREEEIVRASELVATAEAAAGLDEGTVKLWSMIETAKGLGRIESICRADPRMDAVLFGAGDYGADIGVKRLGIGSFRRFEAPAHEYLYARGRVVAAARAAGIDPIDVGHTTFKDLAGTRLAAEVSAQMGFVGSAVFHPGQLPAVNDAFSPPAEDVAWAREVQRQLGGHDGEARAVAVVDGDMVDGPFAINARDILRRHRAIEALEQRKQSSP